MDGCLDVWDYFYKQNDPTLQVGLSCSQTRAEPALPALHANACIEHCSVAEGQCLEHSKQRSSGSPSIVVIAFDVMLYPMLCLTALLTVGFWHSIWQAQILSIYGLPLDRLQSTSHSSAVELQDSCFLV